MIWKGNTALQTLRGDMMQKQKVPFELKFWKCVSRQSDSGCWNWTGEKNSMGYGRISRGGRRNRERIFAHRLSLQIHGRTCPDRMVVRHTCDNPACVNPAHLIVGTQLENANDARVRGRNNAGERNGMAKLALGDVVEIRKLWKNGGSSKDIAARFGIASAHVRKIVARERWVLAA